MPIALALITVGGLLIYSAIHGVGILDVFAGKTGDVINPHGADTSDPAFGGGDFATVPAGDLGMGGTWTAPPGGSHTFKGPNSALLDTAAGVAQNDYHLTITATDNGGHVFNSWHYKGRAFDASGKESDMAAFAKYVHDNYKGALLELIHNPGFAVSDGQDVNGPVFYAAVWVSHKTHVHVAM